MDLELKEICGQFNVEDEAGLLTAKTGDNKQTRTFSTQKAVPVKMGSEKCKRLCDKIELDYHKGLEERVLQYITTTETVDRYGDIVRAKGASFETYYPNNPVIQYSHDYKLPPIGSTIDIKINSKNKTVPAMGLFYDNEIDDTGFSNTIFNFCKTGAMKACSIGFMPIKTSRPETPEEREKIGLGTWGMEYLKWQLLEWSPCSIPANPDALQNYMKTLKTGDFNKDDINVLSKFKLFGDDNLLDMFADGISGKDGKVFDFPQLNLSLEENEEENKEEPEEPEEPTPDTDDKGKGEDGEIEAENSGDIMEDNSTDNSDNTEDANPEIQVEVNPKSIPVQDSSIVVNCNIDIAPLTDIFKTLTNNQEILIKALKDFGEIAKTIDKSVPVISDMPLGDSKDNLYPDLELPEINLNIDN